MMRSYLAMKCAEAWLQAPLDGFGSWAMDQGSLLEDEGIPFVSMTLNCEIERVGLITTDDGKAACSPDGILGQKGLELKCCEAKKHVNTLLAGEVPSEHLPQIHFGMFVTGFEGWRFCSYRRHFPSPIWIVERNEEIIKKIADVLAEFLAKFDAAMSKLEELNGGPAPKRILTPMPQPQNEFASQMPS